MVTSYNMCTYILQLMSSGYISCMHNISLNIHAQLSSGAMSLNIGQIDLCLCKQLRL